MRILLLLITLLFNALYPAMGLGTVCTSDKANVIARTVIQQNNTATNKQHPCHHMNMTNKTQRQHCDCCDDTQTSQHSMTCDSGCCIDTVASSILLTHFAFIHTNHPILFQPVLALKHFYSRHISPELQPPLV